MKTNFIKITQIYYKFTVKWLTNVVISFKYYIVS